MKRKIGKAAVVLIAVLAVAASQAAIATAGQITGSGILHGEQVESSGVFTLTDNGNLTTKCTTATFSAVGEVASGATTATLHPEYSGCTAFGLGATVTTTGCNFVFHLGENTGEEGVDSTADVACSSGSIVISAGTCEVKVDTQNGLDKAAITNSGGAGNTMDLLIHARFLLIIYTVTKDGFLCPLSGTGGTEGDYTGTFTVRLYHGSVAPGNQTSLTVD